MICKHCGDEADDDSCTAMALRENAELRRRVRLLRKTWGHLDGFVEFGGRRLYASDIANLRKPLPKRGRRE